MQEPAGQRAIAGGDGMQVDDGADGMERDRKRPHLLAAEVCRESSGTGAMLDLRWRNVTEWLPSACSRRGLPLIWNVRHNARYQQLRGRREELVDGNDSKYMRQGRKQIYDCEQKVWCFVL